MKYDRNPIIDGLLEGSEIWDHRFECVIAKVLPKLAEILLLVLATTLVPRSNVAQQLQLLVVALSHMIERCRNVLRSERAPLSGFERNHQRVRSTEGCVSDQRNICRAVEKNVVVESPDLIQRIDQRPLKAGPLPVAG